MLNCILHSCIVIGICSGLGRADRVRITHLSSALAFCLHIGSAYKFDTGDITIGLGILEDPLKVRHAVVAIHLKGSKYDGAALVEFPHRLVCQVVKCILEAVVFSIYKDTYIIVVCPLAKCEKSLFKLFVLNLFCLSQGLPLLRCFCKQFICGNGRWFEDCICKIFVTFCKIYGADGLLKCRLDTLWCLLALGRKIEGRLHIILLQVLNDREAILQGLSTHKLFV